MMNVLIKLLVLISSVNGAFYGCAIENDAEIEATDPSIWSIRTCVDDWFAPTIEPNFEPPRVFSVDDYELKKVLQNAVNLGDWILFDELLRTCVSDWESVPEIEEVLEAIASGPSAIIFDLFLGDERIRSDPRIRSAGRIFFRQAIGLSRMAHAFDSHVFECKDFSWAEEIYGIYASLPPEFYRQSLPVGVNYSTLDSSKFMTLVAINQSVPEDILKFLVNDTDVSLAPVPFCGRTISLLAIAELHQNDEFWHILIKCPRYEAEIVKNYNRK